GDRRVQVRGAVAGDLEVVGRGDVGSPQPPGVPAAAGGVGLQAVDRPGGDHAGEVVGRVAVLAGRHVGVAPVADERQALEIVGGDRFLVPGHAGVGQGLPHPDGLLALVAAVGVDVELDPFAHGPAGQSDPLEVAFLAAAGRLGDLDLDPRDVPLVDPRR